MSITGPIFIQVQQLTEENARLRSWNSDLQQRLAAATDPDDSRALREFVQDIANFNSGNDMVFPSIDAFRALPAAEQAAIEHTANVVVKTWARRARAALRNPAGPARNTVLEAACRAWWAVECATGEPWDVPFTTDSECTSRCPVVNGKQQHAIFCNQIKPTARQDEVALAARNEVRSRVRALLNRGALETEVERRTRKEGSCLGDAAALACGLELWGLAGERERRGVRPDGSETTPGRLDHAIDAYRYALEQPRAFDRTRLERLGDAMGGPLPPDGQD